MAEPWVLINIDGQNRPLRFNGAAFSDFEVAYARSIGVPEYPFGKVISRYFTPATNFEVITSYNLLAHLLWAGLKWRWSTLTPELVLQTISAFEENGGDLVSDVWAPLSQAWLATGMFKHFAKKAESEARPGNRVAEPEKEGEKSLSTSSGSAPGTTEPPL